MYEYPDFEDSCTKEGASLLRGECHWPGLDLWLSELDLELEAQ
jgi:hypothetical protein